MKTFFFFTLWGTLILTFSSCCSDLFPTSSAREMYVPKEGLQSTSYDNGSPKLSATYHKDKLEGEFKSWYPNGQLRCVRQYQAGNRVGLETVYYSDGKRYSHGDYRNGNYKTYHRNGRIQMAKDSLESDGTHYYYRWNSAGVLIESVPLVDDKMQGLHQYWSAKGELMAKGQETAGLRTGLWEYYDESGGVMESHDYGEGSSITQQSGDHLTGVVPTYDHDGLAYLSENDNTMGESTAVRDWPGFQDYFPIFRQQLIVEPKPTNMAPVQRLVGYPAPARNNGIEGNVVIRILIDETGMPVDNRVISKVSPYLSNQVEFCLLDLRFTPASYQDEPMPFWVNIPFNFKLLN
ncbi:MAG: TonB family protein [Bacteroidota bacterium]